MRPALRQIVLADRFAQARSTLRAQIVARGGIPATMAVSPAVTESPTASATLGGTVISKDDSRFRWLGGDKELWASDFPGNLFNVARNATISAGGTRGGRCGITEFDISCPRFEIGVYRQGSNSAFRVYVDGELCSNVYGSASIDGLTRYVMVDFTAIDANPVRRAIRIEWVGIGAMRAMVLDTTGSLFAPVSDPGLTGVFLGDSFVEGTGAGDGTVDGFPTIANFVDMQSGLAPYAGKLLGSRNLRVSGVGGTGYVADGSYQSLYDRIVVDGANVAAEVYVVAMGVNDVTPVTTEVAFCLGALRSARTRSLIYVVQPWNASAPTPRSGTPLAVATEIAAVVAGMGGRNNGIALLDPNLVSYTKAISPHPNKAGHATLGTWVADQIKADVGIA